MSNSPTFTEKFKWFIERLRSMALLQQSHAVPPCLGRALRAWCLNASFITECLWLDGFDNQMLMGRGDKRCRVQFVLVSTAVAMCCVMRKCLLSGLPEAVKL